ncbi:MAG: protoporphyrinogen oxidase HemJ [Hyphomicrobiales bacterium]
MVDFLASYYLWLKAFHIISVISWMAGLLYLPRLFVYHTQVETGSGQSQTFKIMERRLLKAIMTPAMLATWVFGLALLASGGVSLEGGIWIHIKLLLVIILSAFHMYLAKCVKRFAVDENTKDTKFYRIINEVPTIIMIVVVILVVVKPF